MYIYTIGHWRHSKDDFVRLLTDHDVTHLVDVRSYPGSRATPHFNREQMKVWLPERHVGYTHLTALGGRRRKQPVDRSLNAGWIQASFRNYADYTLMPGFLRGLQHMEAIAREQVTAYMCAETVPWRCHRLLISNVLVSLGWEVRHILTDSTVIPHVLGEWGARHSFDEEGNVIYPRPRSQQK